jgi:hypothetical protein
MYAYAENNPDLDAMWQAVDQQYQEITEKAEEVMDDQQKFWSLLGNYLRDDEQFATTLRSMINAYHYGRDGSTYAKSLTIRAHELAEYAIEHGAKL